MKKLSVLLVVCLVCSGCQTFFKKQPVTQTMHQSAPEKVWIEAETRKVWVNPHVDENGDMVEGHYKYVVVNPGHWVAKGKK